MIARSGDPRPARRRRACVRAGPRRPDASVAATGPPPGRELGRGRRAVHLDPAARQHRAEDVEVLLDAHRIALQVLAVVPLRHAQVVVHAGPGGEVTGRQHPEPRGRGECLPVHDRRAEPLEQRRVRFREESEGLPSRREAFPRISVTCRSTNTGTWPTRARRGQVTSEICLRRQRWLPRPAGPTGRLSVPLPSASLGQLAAGLKQVG